MREKDFILARIENMIRRNFFLPLTRLAARSFFPGRFHELRRCIMPVDRGFVIRRAIASESKFDRRRCMQCHGLYRLCNHTLNRQQEDDYSFFSCFAPLSMGNRITYVHIHVYAYAHTIVARLTDD